MTNFKELKVGEVLSETQHYTVIKKAVDKVQLRNDLGEDIVVDAKYVDSCLMSADQFTKEEKITKTEAANMLISNPYVALTACYNKQVKAEDVAKQLMDVYHGSTPVTFEAAVKKAAKVALAGEERVIKGRHMGTTDDFGRLNFIDMTLEKGAKPGFDARMRLVDPRTLNWLIVKGVKYIVK